MKIKINDSRKVYAIQKEFSEMFPSLKLDFFTKPHQSGGESPKINTVSPSKTIGQCRTVHSEGTLTISPHMTVSDLVQGFSDIHGLTVRVFRKSGSNWIETSSDMWTLEKQNTMVI
ncbi:MAG: hypothetical protein ACLQQ4_06785 [Bacteroidia bacterium]